jgi:hypothetical protein
MTMMTQLMRVVGFCLLAATVAFAGPLVDGVFTIGEWGAPVLHVNPYLSGTSGPQQSINLYWDNTDPQRLFGAVVGDPSLPIAFFPANIYVYSSGTSLRPNGTPGVYGDGDDLIIGGTELLVTLNGPPWGMSLGALIMQAVNGDVNHKVGGDAGGIVTLGWNRNTLVTEFSIDRAFLGDYDQFRFGGQLYAYEFNRGGGDREPGAMVAATPEPGTLLSLVGGGALLAILRARRRRTAPVSSPSDRS